MAIEYFESDGENDLKTEFIDPYTNVQLPESALWEGETRYQEWHLRVDDLDSLTIFWFGENAADFRWSFTEDEINTKGNFTFHKQGDITGHYRWRPSTPDEIASFRDNPPPRTNIPRSSEVQI